MPAGEHNARKTHCPRGHAYDKVEAGGRRRCSVCDRAARQRYADRNRSGERQRVRVYDATETGRRRARAKHLRRAFGITLEDYERMLHEQGGVCAACGQAWEPTARNPGLCVDHDHETGEVRGLLCDPCNRAAGSVGDDPARLRALADYLDR